MPAEPLTYESLRKRLQAERAAPKLQRLEANFHRDLEQYVRALAADHQREHATNPGGGKATLLGDELQTTRRLADDLYEQRERKIVGAAVSAARGAQADIGPMLTEERELFDQLVKLLQDGRRRVLHRPGVAPSAPRPEPGGGRGAMPQPADPAAAPPAPAAAPAPPPAAGASTAPPEVAEAGRLLVRVLDDVGSFAASDLRTYTLRREELVELPADTARILIGRGKAVAVAVEA